MTIQKYTFPPNSQAGTGRERRFINPIGFLNDVLSVPTTESQIPAYCLLNAGGEV